jgi:hypothetical protein
MSDDPTKNSPDQIYSPQDFDELIFALQELLKKDHGGAEFVSHKIILHYLDSLLDFAKSFRDKTHDSNNFLSMTDLENLVLHLQERQKNLSNDLIWEKLNSLDETQLIIKKKMNTSKKV